MDAAHSCLAGLQFTALWYGEGPYGKMNDLVMPRLAASVCKLPPEDLRWFRSPPMRAVTPITVVPLSTGAIRTGATRNLWLALVSWAPAYSPKKKICSLRLLGHDMSIAQKNLAPLALSSSLHGEDVQMGVMRAFVAQDKCR